MLTAINVGLDFRMIKKYYKIQYIHHINSVHKHSCVKERICKHIHYTKHCALFTKMFHPFAKPYKLSHCAPCEINL